MESNEDKDLDLEDEEEAEDDEDQESDDDGDDAGKDKSKDKSKDKPAKRTDEEEIEHLEGRLKRLRKKTGKTAPKEGEAPKPKPGELDYGQKAYATAKGIATKAEMDLLQTAMRNTGQDLEATLESPFFQGMLKDLRDKEATKEARPTGSRRNNADGPQSVDYWVKKGELPPNKPENAELRRKVVAAKRKSASSSKFYNS